MRFSAPEALDANLIDEAVPADELLARAVSLSASLGCDDHTAVRNLKRSLYPVPLATLGQPTPRRLLASLRAVGAQ
jgi:enoyl-CoA hydratase/carnithine racemase